MAEFDKKKLLELMGAVAPGKATAEQESDDEDVFLKNFKSKFRYQDASRCKFHQHYLLAIFVQNFGAKNFNPKYKILATKTCFRLKNVRIKS